ncbi:fanconi-associated nuclease 1 isoform X2 [Nomia melanderi]|uniref:fanconi-associated nuclease 1 isoform X2 n=1 Tax=Nomia melanderi TaxID=2448451 RepID=UPI00130417C2|nr:fanconi-associated nuclease 1-like isoform X2 [Nomia melanderi]
MLKQKRIDEFFPVTYKSTQKKVKENVKLPPSTQNKIKRKSSKQTSSSKNNTKLKAISKRTMKSSKSNVQYFHDDKNIKTVSQNNSILNNEGSYINVKRNLEENILLSQINKQTSQCTVIHSNISVSHFNDDKDAEIISQNNSILNNDESYINVEKDVLLSQINETTPECTIIYERVNEAESFYPLEMDQPYKDTSYQNIKLMHEDEDYGISFINELQNSNVDNTMASSSNDISLTDKENSPIIKSNTYTPRKLKHSPEVSSNKSPKKIRHERLLDRFMDTNIIREVIENMNLAKQGTIALNNFNLEEIYSKNTFEYSYNRTNIKDSVRYELSNVNLSNDLNATILIGSILTVLSNPFNCGYFEKGELDFIYSILTLPEKAQMLLVRMIKRKRGWHRKSDINYPDISANLKDIFNILESQFICTFDVKTDDLPVILELLHVDELRQVGKSMKIDFKGKKEIIVDKLLQLSKKKPLFHGMKSPCSSLFDCIFNVLDYCVCITDRTWHIIDTIMTLLLPNEDSAMSTADTYFRLGNIYLGKVIYPNVPKNHFPIFSNRYHLLSYVNVKSILSATLKSIENKNWADVRTNGNFAMETLPSVLKDEFLRLKNSKIPMHVRRFMPGYVWLKILSKSVDAFKKCENKTRAVEILKFLLEQDCHMHTRKGKWYCELALITMHHQKDVESTALIIMKALNNEHLSQVDIEDLIGRAKKIQKKKKGIQPDTKKNISEMIDYHIDQLSTFTPTFNTIYASTSPSMRNVPGSKSIWCIENNNTSQSYGSVEALALYYYTKQNFSNGLHCEGNLPILLFTTLLWEELYNKHIPGTFTSPYDDAPADLYTKYFYENRKDSINMTLNSILNNYNEESLSCWMEDRFKMFYSYQSLMPTNLLQHSEHMKEIVHCLGVQGVIGICRRIVENYNLWTAGFPDLIVWNYDTKQHKIVEVKGPNDVLSTKQRLWLKYLNKLGLNTEVCLVQDKKKSAITVEQFDDWE